MAEADHPWPEYIHRSFNAAIANDVCGLEEDTLFGPWPRLFLTLFCDIDGPYDVIPQFKPKHVDFVPVLMVEVDQHPVFFLEIKAPVSLPDESKRQEADEQMRRKFKELAPLLDIPTLYGASAFGTRLACYEYDRATRIIQPPEIIGSDPSVTADVAPIERWDSDILIKDGADRLKDIVKRVKDMTA